MERIGNYFAYMRISTKEERNKQRYNRQEQELNRFAKIKNIEYTLIFKEDASGKNFCERTEWNRLESILQPGDTIVFKDVSRFTREAENGLEKYMNLMNREVKLVFIDNPTISTEYITQLLRVAEEQSLIAKFSLKNTVQLLLLVELDRAEQERLSIIQRTKDGLAATDKKSGRPVGKLDKLTSSLEEDIKHYLSDRSITAASLIKKHKISRNTLRKYAKIVSEKNLKEE